MLIYLEQCREFEEMLPEETRQEIARGAEGAFANYPVYPVTGGHFFQSRGTLLGASCSKDYAFLGCIEGTPPPPPLFFGNPPGQNEGDLLGLTAQQSHLLAAQAEYSVRANKELFRKLLS